MSKHDGDLISRSGLEKFIEDGLNNPDKTKRFGYDAVQIITEVHYAPAVDAVEVVRCGECKHLIDREDGSHGCYRHFVDDCNLTDFCSYGERRDGE